MAYGFNLGQIEGLDSSVKTVTLTIANASESNTYTLNKANEDPLVWSDGLDFQSTTVYIMLTDDDIAGLYVIAFEESDVGDTYNVTISTESIEPNFKDAVEEIVGDRLLPEVTDADNGKVLAVVNGVWNKAEASGGDGDVLSVHLEYDPDAGALRMDKTYAEIQAAHENGAAIRTFYNGRAIYLSNISVNSFEFCDINFISMDTTNNKIFFNSVIIKIDNNNAVTLTEYGTSGGYGILSYTRN